MPFSKHERIFFTGQSGIDFTSSLIKFINLKQKEYSRNGIKVTLGYFKVESEIVKTHVLQEESSSSNFSTNSNKEIWRLILNLPYERIQKLWNQAIQNIILQIKQQESENETFISFISFHSVYYHKRTNEYFSCLNIELLSAFCPTKVITMIDDIYDIHSRLQRVGELFHRSYNCQTIDLILDLFVIQDWRAKEIMMSRFLNVQLNNKNIKSNFFVFAVKHPYDTLENLILNKPVVYLSHPISEVRRLEKKNEHDLANSLLTDMRMFSHKIIERYSTFLPTTIDEFRIQTVISKRKKTRTNLKGINVQETHYTNSLSPRWDKDDYKHPNNIFFEAIDPNDENKLWKENISLEVDMGISSLLKALRSRISSQVTVRDYILVEQSDILIVFRPIFNGNISGGVEEENDYFNTLSTLNLFDGKVSQKVYIYCPKNDVIKLIENNFSKQLDICVNSSKLFSSNKINFKLNSNFSERIFLILEKAKSITEIDNEILLTIFVEILFNQYEIRLELNNIANKFKLMKLPSPLPSEHTPLAGSEERINRQIINTIFVKDFLESIQTFFLYKKSHFIMPTDHDVENMNTFINSIN